MHFGCGYPTFKMLYNLIQWETAVYTANPKMTEKLLCSALTQTLILSEFN